jgi:histone-lysine N-methyltransferase SETMAR
MSELIYSAIVFVPPSYCEMDVLKEQCVCFKVCQKLGKTATETTCDPETKQMSSQWKTPSSPRPKKARQVRSDVKTILIAFFEAEGLMHHELLHQRQTKNQTVYVNILKRLRDTVRRKRPHKWSSGTRLLHHDNAPCYAALSVREFLAKHSIPVVPHPPFLPDLAPCDFFLFSRLKSTLKGKRFQDVADKS